MEEKYIKDYTGFTFSEIDELDLFTYWALLRDAYIYQLNQSESGREYLETCWILEQSNPDKNSLRNKFRKG